MLTKEQIAKLLTSTENLKQKMQIMRSAAHNLQITSSSTTLKMETFQKSLAGVHNMLLTLQQNPEFRGAPVQELLQSVEQTKNSNRSYIQLFQSITPASQEFDRSVSSLILSLEAMSRWLTKGEVSTNAILDYQCPSCHASVRPRDFYCGNCGKQVLPTTDTNWPSQ